MTFHQFPDHASLSQYTAEHIAAIINQKPDALLCLASGDTPIETYHHLVELAKARRVDVSQCTFVGLDEWVGFGPEDAGSCSYYVFRDLFTPLQLRPDQVHVFDAKATDLAAECAKIDSLIDARGGLDLLLVGMGMNGHIALNEPGTPFTLGCHVGELAESTITVGQKYFEQETVLDAGYYPWTSPSDSRPRSDFTRERGEKSSHATESHQRAGFGGNARQYSANAP